jgi:hypothetical protein
MNALMSVQIALITERFITHATVKWPLTAMNALMSVPIALISE